MPAPLSPRPHPAKQDHRPFTRPPYSEGSSAVQLPHRFLVVTPTPVIDEYDNPTPDLDYGPDAPRRVMWGLLQPVTSSEPTEPGRRPVVTAWRLFGIERLAARERIEWRDRVLEVDGEPDLWEPRFGHVHYETRLKHVEG